MSRGEIMDMSFTGVLGGSPKVKLWEFLLVSRGNLEYNIKDIAEGAGITRPTCYSLLDELREKEIVVKGSKKSGKQLYKLNTKSPVVKAMMNAFRKIIYCAA